MSEDSSNSHLVAKSGFFTGLHPGMSIAAKGMIAAFVIFTVMNVEFAGGLYKSIRSWIENGLSFYYITLFSIGLFVCFWLMFSRFGKIRLGDDDSRPEFSNFSWFSMLFSAGIGIGILFFGVAEPIFYFDNSEVWGYPNNPHAELAGHSAMDMQRAVDAMRVTFFHWGFHGWAFYVLVGLSLAYFGFRKKLPLTLRSALYPLIGERIYGPWGHAVDLLAVFGTVFGVATSLGLGVSQMAAGLNHLFGIDPGIGTKLVLIAVVSVIATISAVSGVGKGIRILSEWNIWLSIVLLAAFVLFGPFQWLMGLFVTTVGSYVASFVPMGFWTATEGPDVAWQGGWTIFYWGWWISWSPFVGVFIARISRGRTIREFMVGVMFVPTTIAFFWLCMFGGNAIWQELHMGSGVASADGAGIIQTVRDWNLPNALFGTIDNIGATSWMGDMSWVSWPMSLLATFLLFSWFITSSDSGTLVITTMLSMGDDNPPKKFRIIWGLGEGVVAAALLLAGGLGALQTASIAAAFPISFVLIAMIWGLLKSLHDDPSASPISVETMAPDGTRIKQDLHA
ncbi:BCCT family transporter [Leisingera sp. SS27]|uniref:BCCT family transporter n=1 Tax=Leisingera sp. SS27 TaxID=2979462 RepID=UPI00232EACEB|nr:BCCT family transporter [Leisingera sp. SS27]MDC0659897.1 BCCT family transporter [Leisingera sp. SS27]